MKRDSLKNHRKAFKSAIHFEKGAIVMNIKRWIENASCLSKITEARPNAFYHFSSLMQGSKQRRA